MNNADRLNVYLNHYPTIEPYDARGKCLIRNKNADHKCVGCNTFLHTNGETYDNCYWVYHNVKDWNDIDNYDDNI
jgi:hypothetical protein